MCGTVKCYQAFVPCAISIVLLYITDVHYKSHWMRVVHVIKDCCFIHFRNHLNDLENIVPFLVLGFLYACTGPSLSVLLWHYRIFVVSRFVHTLVYQLTLTQPTRSIAFGVGVVANVSMAVQIIIHFG